MEAYELMYETLKKPLTEELKAAESKMFELWHISDEAKKREKYIRDLYNQSITDPTKKIIPKYNDPIEKRCNIPKDIRLACYEATRASNEYFFARKQYEELFNHNVVQLVYDITTENSMTCLRCDSTKDVFTDYRKSFKPFLILATSLGVLIITHSRNYQLLYNTSYSIVMYQLNNKKKYYRTRNNQEFFDDIEAQMKEYEGHLIPPLEYNYTPETLPFPIPIPLKKAYTLSAQSFWDDYGRTDNYLIIGFMTYWGP